MTDISFSVFTNIFVSVLRQKKTNEIKKINKKQEFRQNLLKELFRSYGDLMISAMQHAKIVMHFLPLFLLAEQET